MAFGVLLHAVHHKQEIRILKMCKNEIWPIYIPHDDYRLPNAWKPPQKAEEHPKKAKYGQNAQKTQKTRFLKKLQSSDFFETCSKIS